MKSESLTVKEKRVLKALIDGIPLVPEPYKAIAKELGLSEEEVIETIRLLLTKRVIRRLGATIRHNLAGYEGNAMVAWLVPQERIEEVGRILSQQPFISHCYVRETYPDWPYNFYTMCHGKSKEELTALIHKIAKELDLREYQVLFTLKEICRKHAQYKIE